ncbi:MAG: site-specific integrase [Defluviitaleaceae bacterium]|nr:site-specific integrase [Defluviitaleaceae bacterium]
MRTNEEVRARMAEDLRLRGLAAGTQEDYLMHATLFLSWANQPAESMDEENIRAYLNYLITEKKLAPATVNTYNAALRFLYAVTLNRNLNYRQIPRLKQVRSLPEIFTSKEIQLLFDNAGSLRNKALFMTLYGAGLRLSEVCNLQIRDIDSESMRIFVRQGKNGKDRYTLLSQANLEVLREYWKAYRPNHSEGWLFLNKDATDKINYRTVQDAFKRTVKRVGIAKDVSVHTLRHCFSTHLLEAGTDVCRIKQLLGHTHIQSTTFYLHLLNFDSKLKSPLDIMPKKRGRKPKVQDNG